MRWMVLVGFLAGCFSTSFDLSRLSAEDQAAAEESISAYEELGCNFGSVLPWGKTISVYYEEMGGGPKSMYEALPGTIRMDLHYPWHHGDGKCQDAVDFQSTIMHELGHVVGMHHTSDPHAVMNPDVGVSDPDVETSGCVVRRHLDEGERGLLSLACLHLGLRP